MIYAFSSPAWDCLLLVAALRSNYFCAGLLLSFTLTFLIMEHGSYAREDPGGATPHLRVPAPPEQCSPQHLSQDIAHLGPNIVLGMAHGYGKDQLHLLVSSFMRHVKDASLVLFAEKVPDRWPLHLKSVHFVTVEIEASLGSASESRFLAYHCFLQAAPSLARVVTVDTRDVVFTGDPFEVYTDNLLHFFQESALKPIGEETYNRDWVRGCTAQLNLPLATENLMGMSVLNSGTMIGPAQSLRQFLGLFTETMRAYNPGCYDQGLLNVLVWSGQFELPPFMTESTEVGRWLTVGLKESHDSTYLIAGNDDLVSKATGKGYVAAHQYDRVPELTAHFHKLYPQEHEHHTTV